VKSKILSPRLHQKEITEAQGWRHGSSGRENLPLKCKAEFKLQYHQKVKRKFTPNEVNVSMGSSTESVFIGFKIL
jgi:hypothetical protein